MAESSSPPAHASGGLDSHESNEAMPNHGDTSRKTCNSRRATATGMTRADTPNTRTRGVRQSGQSVVTQSGTKLVKGAGGKIYRYCNKEGFLGKQGHLIKSWKNRYFVVDRWRVYYLTQPNGKMQGRFNLGPDSKVLSISHSKKPCCFSVLADSGKEYLLQASSQDAKAQWIAVLEHNIQVRAEHIQEPPIRHATRFGGDNTHMENKQEPEFHNETTLVHDSTEENSFEDAVDAALDSNGY